MKRKLLLLCAVLSTLGLIASCSDDKEEQVVDYTMNIYGQSYAMTSGALWESTVNIISEKEAYVYYDTYLNPDGEEVTDEVHGFTMGDKTIQTGNFILSLYGEGLNYNSQLNEVKGEGACISFHLASEDPYDLVDGTYTYSAMKTPFTFTAFSSSLYNMSGISEVAAQIVEGEVTVRRETDGTYSVKYNCKTSSGARVTGDYKGTLDYCSISKSPFASYSDIALEGLQDSVMITEDFLGTITLYNQLDNYNAALYACASGVRKYMNTSKRNDIELAIYYNTETNEFLFQSPIVMRKYFEHDSTFDIPINTKYMSAPTSFTDDDFENLSADDLSFNIEENIPISFQLDNFTPCYVFFKSGTGISGVIKVKSYRPGVMSTNVIVAGLWTQSWMTSPSLVIDIKSKADFKDADIR